MGQEGLNMKTPVSYTAICRKWAAMSIAAGILVCSGCLALSLNRPKPIAVSDIMEMTKASTSADEIIQRMEASRMVYRLKASQLADLAKQGVAGAVIDYMQQTYLDAVRREATYEEWRRMTLFGDDGYGGMPWVWPHERGYIRGHDHRESPHHEHEEATEHPQP